MGGVLANLCVCVPVTIVDCPVLEYISALALTATFVREASENTLPSICYFIPIFAFLSTAMVTLKPKLRSNRGYAIFRGVSLGFVCGCMSFIVDTQDQTGHPFYVGPGSANSPFYIRLIWYMELLHILVLIACLMWTVIHLCEQSSCLGRIPLAVGGAFFVEFIILFTLATLGRLQTTVEEFKMGITLFFILFLMTMVPCMQNPQRAVIIGWLALFLNFLWQTSKWDKNVWNWTTIRFPVPGCLTGYMLVMLTSEPRYTLVDSNNCDNFLTNLAHRIVACNLRLGGWRTKFTDHQIFNFLKGIYRLYLQFARYGMFVAYLGVFCILRIYLSIHQQPYHPADRLMSCAVLLLSFATVQVPSVNRYFLNTTLILIVLCQFVFYICWTFASRFPLNCYAVDSMLGLLMVFVTRKAMSSLEKGIPSLSDTHLHDTPLLPA